MEPQHRLVCPQRLTVLFTLGIHSVFSCPDQKLALAHPSAICPDSALASCYLSICFVRLICIAMWYLFMASAPGETKTPRFASGLPSSGYQVRVSRILCQHVARAWARTRIMDPDQANTLAASPKGNPPTNTPNHYPWRDLPSSRAHQTRHDLMPEMPGRTPKDEIRMCKESLQKALKEYVQRK